MTTSHIKSLKNKNSHLYNYHMPLKHGKDFYRMELCIIFILPFCYENYLI